MGKFKISFYGTCDYIETVVAANKKTAAFIAYNSALKKGIRASLASCSIKKISGE